MKTVSAVVRDGQIALLEPVQWPEGTEVLVQAAARNGIDEPDSLGTVHHLSTILSELIDLRNGPERDEYGFLRPCKRSLDLSSQILIDAAAVAASEGRHIPRGSLSTDSQGGVRVEWIREGSSVHLVVPGKDESAFIYHEMEDEYGTEDATPERLVHWLREIH